MLDEVGSASSAFFFPHIRSNVSYQAMEMMQAFNIGWKPSSMYGIDFDLIVAEARLCCLTLRYNHRSIW